MWKLTEEELQALVSQFERSDWSELRLRMQGCELLLAKNAAPQLREVLPSEAGEKRAPTEREPATEAVRATIGGRAADEIPSGWIQIRAPSLGSFYRSAKPGEPPFVEPGSRVAAETEVCLIEVMKLFTTVRAGTAGVVRKVYPGDAQLVAFDQPLFLLEPDT